VTTAPVKLKTLPATPSRWADIEKLFGERGACGGCWCMFWRKSRKQYEAEKGAKNKQELKQIVIKGSKPGIIAYVGKEPVGWCAVAPRSDYVALERSRILKPVDDQPVWSVSCLFVRKDYRRQGIASILLRAAVQFASRQGARIVEGYPVEPSMKNMPDAFLWHGVPSAFKAAGFKEVLRRSQSRPIMRYVISDSRNKARP
jgi:GNAT superfamily N-acetyltransferase